ncbi:MAG: porin family protein, partial [Flavobacteriales bacterium]
MRKTLLLALLMAPFLSRAQDDGDLRLGVKLAPNFHWLRSDSKELKRDGTGLGYTFGLVSELAIDDRQAYYFSSGVLFNHIGGAFTATFSKEVDGVSTSIRSKQELRVNYLEVPMTLKLRAVNDNPLTFYGQFGASAGFKLRARSTFTTTTTVNGASTTVSDTD